MPENIPLRDPEFAFRNKFTSDSGRLNDIKLHSPDHRRVARVKHLAIRGAPQRIQPAHRCEFHTNIYPVEDLDPFPYLEHVQNIADWKSQPPPTPWPRTEIYPGTGTAPIDYIAEPLECDAQG